MEAAEKERVLAAITDTMSYEDCRDADLIVEAIAEDMEVKCEIFKMLDGICKPEAILATNTSSLSVTQVAAVTSRPDRVIGMHFFNPVPAMKLVEVIRGQLTSPAVHDQVVEIARKLDKVPVSVNEAPGFVVNRILIPMINEGVGILADGVASKEEIDEALALGETEGRRLVPSGDFSGHGTAVLGIAAGNGRASEGVNRGVAYRSDLLVVKMGNPRENSFPRTTELMEGIDYLIRQAVKMRKPIVINISLSLIHI